MKHERPGMLLSFNYRIHQQGLDGGNGRGAEEWRQARGGNRLSLPP